MKKILINIDERLFDFVTLKGKDEKGVEMYIIKLLRTEFINEYRKTVTSATTLKEELTDLQKYVIRIMHGE